MTDAKAKRPARWKRRRPWPSVSEGSPGRATCRGCRAPAGLLVTLPLDKFHPLGTDLGQPDNLRTRLAAELLVSLAHRRSSARAQALVE
jgi:hypothetical protein